MGHSCKKESSVIKCKFALPCFLTDWCGKVVRCPDCGEKVNYKLRCKSEGCILYEAGKWYHLSGGTYKTDTL